MISVPKRRTVSGGGGALVSVAAVGLTGGHQVLALPAGAGRAELPPEPPVRPGNRYDDLIYGALPDAGYVLNDPYAPFSQEEWRRYDILHWKWQESERDLNAAPLTPDEAAELHGYILRLVQYYIALPVRLGNSRSLRVYLERGPEFSYSQYNSFRDLLRFEQSLTYIAPNEPRVADAVLDAVRQRVQLMESGNYRAAAGDLRERKLVNSVVRALNSGQPGLGEMAGNMSDRGLGIAIGETASRLEDARVALMPFAIGGDEDVSLDIVQEKIDEYGRFASIMRPLAEEAERRGQEMPEEARRALRQHEAWGPRFEQELERRRRASRPS